MRKLIWLFFVVIISIGARCEKEGENCHYSIVFWNNSSETVLWGSVSNGNEGCRMTGNEIEAGKSSDYRPYHSCIEDRFGADQVLEIYIIDPEGHNPPDMYYDCDSVEIYNEILMKYELSLNELKEKDFRIDYP
jgi:hypothetical protein